MDTYIQGKCMDMCPRQERRLREKEKLLHVLEVVQETKDMTYPRADKNRTVKSFCRSAAGKNMQKETELRPPDVLLKTVDYLLQDVVIEDKLPWYMVYDFVMDRLRAVRQDMIIQNVSKAEWISILQPIIRFHAYSAYRLCTEDTMNFDPTINKTHLQECLKRLLSLYDDTDELYGMLSNKLKTDCFCVSLLNIRPEFEALYIVLNLGNEEALRRAMSLPKIWRSGIVRECIELSLNFLTGNFVRAGRIILKLPVLLAATASLYLPQLRRKAFDIMSTAYSSKNLSFPIESVKNMLLYDSEAAIIEDCKHYELQVTNKGINFNKVLWDSSKAAVSPKHYKFVEDKFVGQDLPTLLLSSEN